MYRKVKGQSFDKMYNIFSLLDSTLTTDWILYTNAVKDEAFNVGTLASCFLSMTSRYNFQVIIPINSCVCAHEDYDLEQFFSQFADAFAESGIGSVWVQKTC